MLDSFGRTIDYLRLSITDRCDLRCKYCMPEKPVFSKKSSFLSLKQLKVLSRILIKLGIKKIRITGGEPLVRKDILEYLEFLHKQKVNSLLNEILMTTNGTQLKKHAKSISNFGIKRLNVSIDSIIPEKYNFITNGGSLEKVLNGIEEAKKNGIEIKINTVLLKNFNEDEVLDIAKWCATNNLKLSFIEVMPIGNLQISRTNQYLPVSFAKKIVDDNLGLVISDFTTNGPSRYFRTLKFNSTIGFISPISNHFCPTCNRIRITSSGILYPCLGDNNCVDLKPYLEKHNIKSLIRILEKIIFNKPEKHHFKINEKKSDISRFMNTTGG